MAYLDYYRTNPNWATNQWQSLQPPAPSFQPQPSWGGQDFYRAIAGPGGDGGLYDYAYGRLQGLGGGGLAQMGPSMVEAKMCHRRAYGGLGDILTMAPTEIGAAAAYEVWRNWRYNYGVLAQPLSGDAMRQREALVGLAIGEATKLWQYTTRMADPNGRLAAVEAAAIAAALIFDQGNDLLMRGGGGYGNGIGAGSGMGGMGGGMGMGALSPALSASGVLGGAGAGAGMGGMNGMSGMGGMGGVSGGGMGGMGMSTMGGGRVSPVPSTAMGMGMGGMNSGMGGVSGGGMGGMGGMGMSSGMAGMPGSTMSGLSAPPFVRRRSLSVGAAPPGFGNEYDTAGMGMGGYAGSNSNSAMGMSMGAGQGMYGGAGAGVNPNQQMLSAGYSGIQRPLSASGGAYAESALEGYGPGQYGETALARHERHRAERAAERAERAALKEVRFREQDGYPGGGGGRVPGMGMGRAYDDNYQYEYGRGGGGGGGGGGGYGGYGSDYGDAGGYGDGYGLGMGGGGGYERPRYGRHGHRRHRAERAAERLALEAGAGAGGRYGGGMY